MKYCSLLKRIINRIKSKSFINYFLAFLAILLATESIILIVINLKLRGQIKLQNNDRALFLPSIDYSLNNLELIDLNNGQKYFFEFDNINTLLYIVKDFCIPCNELNFVLLKRLSFEFRDKINILFIIASPKIDQHKNLESLIKFSKIYTPLDIIKFHRNFKITSAPLTVFINEYGIISFLKQGNLSSEDYLKIENIAKKEV